MTDAIWQGRLADALRNLVSRLHLYLNNVYYEGGQEEEIQEIVDSIGQMIRVGSVAVDNQPAPLQEPVGVDIGELVISDLRKRIEYGKGKYGVSLHSHDGRDTLVDAFQEALDLALYLRKVIVERDDNLR